MELRCTVNTFAPGPLMVRFLLINNSPLVKVMVVIPTAKLIVSPVDALRIACRSVPGQLSAALVTVRVAACAATALKSRALINPARRLRPTHPRNLTLRPSGDFSR